MGGHGGLNILPQKRWNVYNYDNREKVRKDEEAAAKEEQLKREQSRKRDSEFRIDFLRRARGITAPSQLESEVKVEPEPEEHLESDSKHINLFEGIRIFDPVVVDKKKRGEDDDDDEEEERRKKKKVKVEEKRVVGPDEEKYRLGYGVAGKGVNAPWYTVKPKTSEEDEEVVEERSGTGTGRDGKEEKKMKKKKTVEELREERLKRERKEKERERALLAEKKGWSGGRGGSRDEIHRRRKQSRV